MSLCTKHNRYSRIDKCPFCIQEEKEIKQLDWEIKQLEKEINEPIILWEGKKWPLQINHAIGKN